MPLFHGTVDSAYVLGEVRLHFYLLFCYLDNTILILIFCTRKKGIIMNLLSPFLKNLSSSYFYGIYGLL